MKTSPLPKDADDLRGFAESIATALSEKCDLLGVTTEVEAPLRAAIAAATFASDTYVTVLVHAQKSPVGRSYLGGQRSGVLAALNNCAGVSPDRSGICPAGPRKNFQHVPKPLTKGCYKPLPHHNAWENIRRSCENPCWVVECARVRTAINSVNWDIAGALCRRRRLDVRLVR
jgi:hypothetical protein